MPGKEADDAVLLRFRKMSRPVRVIYGRPRTFVSVAIGIVVLVAAGKLQAARFGAAIKLVRVVQREGGVHRRP